MVQYAGVQSEEKMMFSLLRLIGNLTLPAYLCFTEASGMCLCTYVDTYTYSYACR